MKRNSLYTISLLIGMLLMLASCEPESIVPDLNNITAPANVSLLLDITQDNTGIVSFYPNAEGAVSYQLTFGDQDNEIATSYELNQIISHTYQEGNYSVQLTAIGITGLETTLTQELVVSFIPPSNLQVTIEISTLNPRLVTVSATADYATVIDFYFGDVTNEVPVQAQPGEEVDHLYATSGDYVVTAIARSGGSGTASFSDTISISAASDPVEMPIDFESFTINYAFTDFGNAVTQVANNPNSSGINSSSRVGKSTKQSGADTWAGSFLTLGNAIDFSSNKMFKVKVLSPKSGAVVKLKVEHLTDGGISKEVDAMTTTTNQWEELAFDFSDIATENAYHKVVIFFDFGNPGDGAVYYFDDIRLVPANLPAFSLIEDFEGTPPVMTVFGNIAGIEILANPVSGGVNTSATVAKLTKSNGADTWAGAFFDPAEVLNLQDYHKISVKTWSPKAGIDIKVKLENSDASITYETDVTSSAVSDWENLVFDFTAAPAASYTRVVIFFDFGNPGDGTVYYFDDFTLTN